jgi:hypothetical protein
MYERTIREAVRRKRDLEPQRAPDAGQLGDGATSHETKQPRGIKDALKHAAARLTGGARS